MKHEQLLGIIFSILGVSMGMLSAIAGNLYIAVPVSVAAYGGAMFLSSRMMKEKKIQWVVMHSIGTFVLTWIVSWIFLFNTW